MLDEVIPRLLDDEEELLLLELLLEYELDEENMSLMGSEVDYSTKTRKRWLNIILFILVCRILILFLSDVVDARLARRPPTRL